MKICPRGFKYSKNEFGEATSKVTFGTEDFKATVYTTCTFPEWIEDYLKKLTKEQFKKLRPKLLSVESIPKIDEYTC